MKPCVLEFPDGRIEHVSLAAGEFALVIDLVGRYPALAKHFASVLENVKNGVDGLALFERINGHLATEKLIAESFKLADASR